MEKHRVFTASCHGILHRYWCTLHSEAEADHGETEEPAAPQEQQAFPPQSRMQPVLMKQSTAKQSTAKHKTTRQECNAPKT